MRFAMKKKKFPTKYTINFDSKSISHLKAMKILDSVSVRSKAQLIAEALLLYNRTLELIDVSSVDDIQTKISEAETYEPKKKSKSRPEKIVLELEDDDENFIDIDDDEYDDEYEDNAFSDVFKQNLMSMGIKKDEDD